jgi:(p)ppGpp synthase/HD superfamily hydrolase
MSRLLIAARNFATGAHRAIDQRRKYTGECYSHHLHRVVEILRPIDDDEHTLAAAYLHDVVEDTKVTLADITGTFGMRVGGLVYDLTSSTEGNRATRKAADRARFSSADPAAKTIKLADIVDNITGLAKHDPSFARVYLAEKALLLPHLRGGDPILYTRVEKQVAYETASIR